MSFGTWLSEGGNYVLYLSGIAGGLTALAGLVIKFVRLAKKPLDKLEEKSKQGDQELHARVDAVEQFKQKHEDCKEHVNDCLYQDNIKLGFLMEGFALMMRAVMVLISHALTDNHFEQLRKERDSINEFLLETPTTFSRRKGRNNQHER